MKFCLQSYEAVFIRTVDNISVFNMNSAKKKNVSLTAQDVEGNLQHMNCVH